MQILIDVSDFIESSIISPQYVKMAIESSWDLSLVSLSLKNQKTS